MLRNYTHTERERAIPLVSDKDPDKAPPRTCRRYLHNPHTGRSEPTRTMSRRQPTRILSLEQTLEQERLEILASLDGSRSKPPSNDPSPVSTRHGSMELDCSPGTGSVLPPRHGSIAGIGVGVTPPSRYYSSHSNDNNNNNPYRRTWTGPASSSPLRLSSSAASMSSLPLSAHEQAEEEEQKQRQKQENDSTTTATASSAPPRRSSDGTVRSHERKKSVGKASKPDRKSVV